MFVTPLVFQVLTSDDGPPWPGSPASPAPAVPAPRAPGEEKVSPLLVTIVTCQWCQQCYRCGEEFTSIFSSVEHHQSRIAQGNTTSVFSLIKWVRTHLEDFYDKPLALKDSFVSSINIKSILYVLYFVCHCIKCSQGFVLKVNLSSDNSENRSLSLHSVENSNISRNFYTIGAL